MTPLTETVDRKPPLFATIFETIEFPVPEAHYLPAVFNASSGKKTSFEQVSCEIYTRMSNENLAETLFPKPFVLHLYKTYYPKHQHSAPLTESVPICKNPNRASRYQNIRRIDSIRRYINNTSEKNYWPKHQPSA